MYYYQFCRDASHRLTFEMSQVPCGSYSAICEEIVETFGLIQDSPLVTGLHELFQYYRRGEQIVSLEWDTWLGFTVVAKNPDTEPLVREIAAYLKTTSWADLESEKE